MNLAANFAELTAKSLAEADIQRLLERLTDVEAEIVYFPVRHHSPVAAQLAVDLIEQLRPSAVLIEGPSDFNDQLDELLLEHELPIAIYSYFRTVKSQRGAWYPFCEYSPEWSAVRAGRRCGAIVRFIDLPWKVVARYEQNSTHRYADAELRLNGCVQKLCRRFEVEDFDDLWDVLVESQRPLALADYLQRVHSLCFHMRLWGDRVKESDSLRESFMVRQIRTIRKQVAGKLLVITGGFHSSAIAARYDGLSCPGIQENPTESELPPEETIVDAGIALTTYSYERLDNLSGYEAGMPNPGFYEYAWRQMRSGHPFDHQPLLAELVIQLRRRGQILRTADLIAVETTARGLAALRGRAHVWRRDLVDAVASSLVKDELEYGCESPFVDAVHAVLRGNRHGRLAAGTRLPPLVPDIRQKLAAAGLSPAGGNRQLELDLLSSDEVQTSQLLHQLRILEISGFERIGGTDFLNRGDLSKLQEIWEIRWGLEFESSCIEAARYGTSPLEAATARLADVARQRQKEAAAAAALLVQAALAGIQWLSVELVEQLRVLIREEKTFTGATSALGHILFLCVHSEAFGIVRISRLDSLLDEAFSRSLWLLDMLGKSAKSDYASVQGMRTLLEVVQQSDRLPTVDRGEFLAVMCRVEGDQGKSAAIRGAAAGILWTFGAADDQQILADLLRFALPTDLGDFLAGLFGLAREVAQRNAGVVQTIDRLLSEFGADDFQLALPSLRLAFTRFTPREKHHMLTTLFSLQGTRYPKLLAKLEVSEAEAAEAIAFEERLFEAISRYGLEELR